MSLPRTRSLRLTPDQIVRHGDAIAAFCLAQTVAGTGPDAWDFTVEFIPDTFRPSGRLLFHAPGQTTAVRDFVLSLEKETP